MGNKKALPGRQPGPSSQWAPGYNLSWPVTPGPVSVSSTNTYTSETFNCADFDNIGLQVEFVGTMTGTLVVNCSIDNANWTSLTFNPALSQPAGSSLTYLIDLNQLPFPYLQLSYTNSSGSGTLAVFVSGKDLN
jgi:hypothetical protein